MDRPTVLVIGQLLDPHIDAVRYEIEAAGGRSIFLNRHDLLSRVAVSISNETATTSIRSQDEMTVQRRHIHSVWWRAKPVLQSEMPVPQATISDTFRWNEWNCLLRSLNEMFPSARWINSPDAQASINRKPVQLLLAREVGLRIPDTVFTNDVDAVLNLCKRHERIIYKALSGIFIPPDKFIYTKEIDVNYIYSNRNAFALAPGIFQNKIEKRYELRVTIIGNTSFAVKIASQSTELTSVDWRVDQHRADLYSIGELNPDTRTKLLEFHQRAGLEYAAYDFIVDTDGNEVFLECNPAGQWLWLEDYVDIGISKALAAHLCFGCSDVSESSNRKVGVSRTLCRLC